MKTKTLLFLAMILCFNVAGQNSFENEDNCTLTPNYNYAHIECAETWHPAYGNPSIVRETSTIFGTPKINAPNGEYFAMTTYKAENAAGNCFNEVIYKDLGPLTPGANYILTFQHRIAGFDITIGDPADIEVGYTSGLVPNQTYSLGSCESYGQTVYSATSFDKREWTEVTTSFVADAENNQLTFGAYPNIQGNEGYYLVDNVILVECNDFAPEYIFVNEDGDEVDSYCYGEDVYIYIDDVQYTYDHVYISAESQGVYLTPGWQTQITAGGPYNISQIFRDNGLDPFTPDQIWDFKLAVEHPDCGWVERVQPFEYVCCEINSGFDLEESGLPAPYNVEATALFDYTSYGGSHEFCLYTDEDHDDVYEVVQCASSPSLFAANLQEGVRYYISHVVTTPCGQFCESIDFCAGSGCDGPVSAEICDILIPPTCLNTPPEGLSCPRIVEGGENSSTFDIAWDPIPGVGLWEIEIIQADPECGCAFVDVSYIDHDTGILRIDGNFARITAGDCFSYRVRAWCPEGEWGPWSDKICYPSCNRGGIVEKPNIKTRNSIHFDNTSLEVYPNPFQNDVNIKLQNTSSEKVDISIYNQVGQLIYNSTIIEHDRDVNTVWTPSNDVPAGLYFVRVSNGSTVINKKLLHNK